MKEFSVKINNVLPHNVGVNINHPEEVDDEIERFMPVFDDILAVFDKHQVQFDEAYDITLAIADTLVYLASQYEYEQNLKNV